MSKEQTDGSKKAKKTEKDILIDIELLIYRFSHLSRYYFSWYN